MVIILHFFQTAIIDKAKETNVNGKTWIASYENPL